MNEKILQGKELAELLGIAPASVSISAKKDYLVKKKYPISEWANRDARGRIIDYRVSEKVYQELDRSKNYEKKYDRETDEATCTTCFYSIKCNARPRARLSSCFLPPWAGKLTSFLKQLK